VSDGERTLELVPSGPERTLQVVRAGTLTTVQDAGRPGLAHLGVPPSGALDRPAWQLANRLVGNRADAAALETTLDGVTVRAGCDSAVAVTGAPATVTLDGRPAAWGAAIAVRAHATIDVGRPAAGLRCYVAISGGVCPAPSLGSRSRDLLSELGPAPLRAGDMLTLGPSPGPPPAVDVAPQPAPPTELELTLWSGPRAQWLTDAGRQTLHRGSWTVSSDSNRIGLRLEGPALALERHGELRSEGMVTGAVQVPPDGRPVIFLADHPTTGGYPVIGVIDPAELAQCAQARPGVPVRFHPREIGEASS
jgi:biotin-dependent carboxylase-like uncharacterized protein